MGYSSTQTVEWEQSTLIDQINLINKFGNFLKIIWINRHLKKARGHNGQNVVMKTIKMRILVLNVYLQTLSINATNVYP